MSRAWSVDGGRGAVPLDAARNPGVPSGMSYDDSETTYHLTPNGWTTGDAPADRVETWLRSVRQQSGWSKEYIDWRCMWVDPAIPRTERDATRKKHREFMGPPGRHGSTIISIGDPL